MRDANGLIMRDAQGKVLIAQVLKFFLLLLKNLYLKVFPEISKEFAFYYKLLYYTILETMVKLVIPLVILIYTNLSIYKLVNKENPFVSSCSTSYN